ncbi:MAG TPA: amidohydrolase family protein [Bryobacteraceae bacterium]|nr:amidohydrolase family protein [Bryobacteraceae bacterium]
MRIGLLLLALFLVCTAALAAAPPTAIAIRDARIITVAGPIIEHGTVLVRDGLIEAAGTSVDEPAGTWIIDGKGLTVYPGLIDALSTLGLPDHAPQPAGARRGGSPAAPPGQPTTPATLAAAPARGPEDRPSNSSWLHAADILNTSDKRIETARAMGFTSAVSFPTRGIFAGQGAVVNLGGEKPGDMVVATPVGLYLTLTARGGFSEFPGSLMGAIAYIRQVSADAEHYRIEKAVYSKSAAGRKRPAYDRAVEAYIEAPRVLLPARTAVEIARMARFASELNTPAVLYGAPAGYAVAEELAKAKLPVLVSLKWPEREREADPEIQDDLRTLQLRDQAPATPAALVKAGVPFALYLESIATERDMKRATKRALDAGLAHRDLVAALTLRPAEIFGVADRLGSIEKGKIANLVVTDGDLFGEKTKVKYVFVDGVKYEPAPEPEESKKTEEAK